MIWFAFCFAVSPISMSVLDTVDPQIKVMIIIIIIIIIMIHKDAK